MRQRPPKRVAFSLCDPGKPDLEDELILAVPVVPVKPGSEAVERDWPATQAEQDEFTQSSANPFAALSALKSKPNK